MRKVLLIAVIVLLASCQNNIEKELPKTLDEVEFFYYERTAAHIYHVDPTCGPDCVYTSKDDINEHLLCGKCISKELAREIMSKQ
jgi:hypothetical protein